MANARDLRLIEFENLPIINNKRCMADIDKKKVWQEICSKLNAQFGTNYN